MMRDAHPNGKSENNLQFDRKEEATVTVRSHGRLFWPHCAKRSFLLPVSQSFLVHPQPHYTCRLPEQAHIGPICVFLVTSHSRLVERLHVVLSSGLRDELSLVVDRDRQNMLLRIAVVDAHA